MSRVISRKSTKLLTICMIVISILIGTTAFAASRLPKNIKGAAILLKQLEISLKPTSLQAEWKNERKKWLINIKDANNVQQLRALVYRLELNLKYNSQYSGWSTNRNDWVVKIKNTENLKELVNLIVKLETCIKWEAQKTSWRNQRKKWILAANSISGSTIIPKKLQEEDHILISSLKRLSKIVLELEKKIKYSAQLRGWKAQRKKWVKTINKVENRKQLLKIILAFYNNIRKNFLAKVWKAKHEKKWLIEIKKTKKVKTLAKLIIELERGLKWSAHFSSWWNKREKWIEKINRITGRRKIPLKYDTHSPASERTISKFITLIGMIEDSVLQNNYKRRWTYKRSNWLRKLYLASSSKEIAAQLLTLKKYMYNKNFSKKWKGKYKVWLKSVKKIKNFKQLVKVLREFETALVWKSQNKRWKWNRRLWHRRLNTLEGTRSRKVPAKMQERATTSQQQTQVETPEIKKKLRLIANLVVELERDLLYKRKIKLWKFKWLKKVLNVSTVKELGNLVYKLEAKFPYKSQAYRWKKIRKRWVSQIKNVSDIKKLIAHILKCERSFKWKAHTKFWRKRRRSWILRLNKISKTKIIQKKYQEGTSGIIAVSRNLRMSAELLLELESQIKSFSYRVKWNNIRTLWIKKVLQSNSFEQLAIQMKKLENVFKSVIMSKKWIKDKKLWKTNINSIRKRNAFFNALIELERNIKWRGHFSSWILSRTNWYERVNKILRNSFIPDKNLKMTRLFKRNIDRLAVTLIDLERGIKKSVFRKNWKTRRTAWLMRVFSAKTPEYLSGQILQLLENIKQYYLSRRWKNIKKSWNLKIRKANTLSKLANLVFTLERALKWNSHEISWKIQRKLWVRKINLITGSRIIRGKL